MTSTAMLFVLRTLHVVGGVFWAGTMLFFAIFLEPSIREAGPDGAKVMGGLLRRKYITVMPIVAGITILAGVGLLEIASGGFHPEWMSSPSGIVFSLGGAIALLTFLIGVFFVRPSALKLMALMPQMAQAEAAAREALQAQAQGLRTRLRRGGRVVAVLLAVTTILMAVGRYAG